jgi:hypothetical protein
VPNHNFGECPQCGCLTTMLMEVTHLATGEKTKRVCCRAYPSHSRPATIEDIRLEYEARKGDQVKAG